MTTSSNSRTRSSGPVLRSLSPSGRFHTCSHSHKSLPSTTTSNFSSSFAFVSSSSTSSSFFHRSSSPTRVNLYSAPVQTSSVRISIDRSISFSNNLNNSNHHSHNHNHFVRSNSNSKQNIVKKTCMCSPTTHPGSFRCSLHKGGNQQHQQQRHHHHHAASLNMRRSAMTNSLVRIGGVEGEWVKRALTALIRPSSHQQRRRSAFEPRPSRLSVMSKAEDL